MNLRKSKKGFTLVEIIVVLVIIAILAAVAIPTMMGFVDDARKSGAISEAKAGLTAAQMVVTKASATGDSDDAAKAKISVASISEYLGAGTKIQDIATGDSVVKDGRLTKFVCWVDTNGTRYKVTIDTDTGEATADKTGSASASSAA